MIVTFWIAVALWTVCLALLVTAACSRGENVIPYIYFTYFTAMLALVATVVFVGWFGLHSISVNIAVGDIMELTA